MLHQVADGPSADEPVEVRHAGERRGHAIPQPEKSLQAHNGPIINKDRIRQIMEETHTVSGILYDIFGGGDIPEGETDEDLDGLDQRHRTLLIALLNRQQWDREDVERLADACGLMPDGALDTINEWGWEAFGEAILEHGAQVSVYREVFTTHQGMHFGRP